LNYSEEAQSKPIFPFAVAHWMTKSARSLPPHKKAHGLMARKPNEAATQLKLANEAYSKKNWLNPKNRTKTADAHTPKNRGIKSAISIPSESKGG
jgi:hypothetical protein